MRQNASGRGETIMKWLGKTVPRTKVKPGTRMRGKSSLTLAEKKSQKKGKPRKKGGVHLEGQRGFQWFQEGATLRRGELMRQYGRRGKFRQDKKAVKKAFKKPRGGVKN